MPPLWLLVPVLVATTALWSAGLWLFLHAGMTTRRKVSWVGVLVVVGVFAGLVLPLPDLWTRFLWLMAIVPVVAVADVFLVRASRGLTYWIRACGFEVVTTFSVAAVTRFVLGLLHVTGPR